ncbi:hypothetical protein AYO44_07490 [Planctomycetaceae bacterium SCGC AG-212-F19]|nr:hypothetical protein AYO44_07490 [Planctomycetaceae bacterium SCGC AG-212-F19]
MAEVENVINGPLARVLQAGRPRFNALFARARQTTPTLDGAAFAHHLRQIVSPIADAVAAVAADRLGETVNTLYELSLDLVGKDLGVRYPAVLQGWMTLLRDFPAHLASAPRLFAGSVTNALYNLATVSGARPEEWLTSMPQVGSRCADVTTFLEAGKICAWRAGMAHYRQGALETCRRLSPQMAGAALGAPDVTDAADIERMIDRLRDDPWLSVQAAAAKAVNGNRRLRVVKKAGGFRGFGGPFPAPPSVTCVDGEFLVHDGESSWHLKADRFGATLQRTENGVEKGGGAGPFRISANGTVKCGEHSERFPELQGNRSSAANQTTLAVTVPLSHLVYLVALAE